MPVRRPYRKNQTYERPTYTEILWEQLQDTKTEVKETRKELNQRMDRLETRMDRINARLDKQDAKIDKLADKIDALHNEIKSSTGHISIANISTVGIALGVLYSILSK